MCIEGKDIVFDLILIKSGHYVLPLDTFKESMVKRAEHKSGNERLILFNNRVMENKKVKKSMRQIGTTRKTKQFIKQQ